MAKNKLAIVSVCSIKFEPFISSLSSTISRRKGENAQQVIDLSAALKVTEKEVQDKQVKIESLEAEMLILSQDLKQSEARASELESTNQLLKVLLNVKRHNCKTDNILFTYIQYITLVSIITKWKIDKTQS